MSHFFKLNETDHNYVELIAVYTQGGKPTDNLIALVHVDDFEVLVSSDMYRRVVREGEPVSVIVQEEDDNERT